MRSRAIVDKIFEDRNHVEAVGLAQKEYDSLRRQGLTPSDAILRAVQKAQKSTGVHVDFDEINQS